MESAYTQPIIEMGISLAELAVKGTASAVNKKNTSRKRREKYRELTCYI